LQTKHNRSSFFYLFIFSLQDKLTTTGLKKIADALDSTVDFLVNGNTEDKAKASLVDAEVIRYFKEVDTLPTEDKTALLRVIAGFIRDVKTKQAYAS
jgi:hypothetical protein